MYGNNKPLNILLHIIKWVDDIKTATKRLFFYKHQRQQVNFSNLLPYKKIHKNSIVFVPLKTAHLYRH